MSSPDPRTPVIVGVGHHDNREGDAEPVAMMVAAADQALDDAYGQIQRQVRSVRIIQGIWPYQDPARLLADRLGLDDVQTAKTRIGGNEVYDALTRTCSEIAAGDLEAALICSAETLRTRRRDRAAGRRSAYLAEDEAASPDVTFGSDHPMATDLEMSSGMGPAVNFYAAAEIAMRHRLREAPREHLERISALWARASEVAAANPHAWLREVRTPADIATPGPANRMVAAPYCKLMTSNINVDQSAAVLVCSAAAATAAGVPPDRWIFPLSGTEAADTLHMSTRRALDDSPAMRAGGRRVLELASTDISEVGLIDLYSCFPSAVELAQELLGVDPSRPFTITGGLTFAGGPLNSYCMHALVRAVELLRESDEELALLTGNGGFFTKHAFSVLGVEPPAQGYRSERVDVSAELNPRPTPKAPVDAGTVEAYTVTFTRDGAPDLGIVSVLDDSDTRTWATTHDACTIDALLSADLVGTTVRVEHDTAVPTVALVG